MPVEVTYATEPGDPGVPNEDFVAASPSVAVVLDGVTPVDRADTGCRHGVAWYATRVGTEVFRLVAGDVDDGEARSPRPLTDCLADAIALTRDAHADTCDLDHFDSPAATVAVVRLHAGRLEYLVLSDAAVVLDLASGQHAHTDHRAGEVGRRLRAESGARPSARAVRSHRNRPGGYWVAAERPEAAYEALTGSVPAAELRRAMVATDGATRLVDTFGTLDWTGALDALEEAGVDAWIARTRAAERAAPALRGKVHDDATVVLLRTARPRPAPSPEPADPRSEGDRPRSGTP